MKIAFVNHTFPPHSCAGSELCVLHLARELRRHGAEPYVFYRVNDPSQDEYALNEGDYEGVRVCSINHTYKGVSRFQQIYSNPVIGARFNQWLRRHGIELVHFHHLTNLSLTLPAEAKAAGAATVMTLHDYWLLCQRGQLLRRDLSRCDGPSPAKCRSCLSLQLLRGDARRWAGRLLSLARRPGSSALADLTDMSRARIETPEASFVQKTCFHFGDTEGETLLAHPPSMIEHRFDLERPARFRCSVSMHPNTFDQAGGGVSFHVRLNGETIAQVALDPKRNPSDRGWRELDADLPAGRGQTLALTTASLEDDPQFCAAGWRAPRIEAAGAAGAASASLSVDRLKTSGARRWLERAADLIVHASPTAREGVAHRRNLVQRVFEQIDLFVSPSEFLRDFFIEHGMPAQKIIYSDNGFPAAPPASPRHPEKPLRFGYIGTWIPSKGVDLLLRAFQDISPDDATLSVYGFFPGYDGFEAYEDELRSMAGPAVRFEGRYEPGDVYRILSSLDCVVVPSIWWENSPMTIHEAFQMKTPVIAADAGGMAELVNAGGGVLFRHRDADDLRRVIAGLIDRPARLAELSASAPQVKRINEHADELAGVYQRLLDGDSK